MIKLFLVLLILSGLFAVNPTQATTFETDTIPTSNGDLIITFIGHGTLMFQYGGMVIHVDPWSKLADYSALPKADLILVTHHHGDHLDPEAIKTISSGNTIIVSNKTAGETIGSGMIMANGDQLEVSGLKIEAAPAYNLVHMREENQPYHEKGDGNGYIVDFGGVRVYIAGDSENTPEMKALSSIDVAFLPMNLPYTMTPEMVYDAVREFKPKILYPYHYGQTDVSRLEELMKDLDGVELRIKPMS